MSEFKAIQTICPDWRASDYSVCPGITDNLYLVDMVASDFSVGVYTRSMCRLSFGRVIDDFPEFDEEYFAEERSAAPQNEPSIQKVGCYTIFTYTQVEGIFDHQSNEGGPPGHHMIRMVDLNGRLFMEKELKASKDAIPATQYLSRGNFLLHYINDHPVETRQISIQR